MTSPLILQGVIPPLLTPFSDGGKAVDEVALGAHVEWLIAKGIHGVMPCGTTSEGPLLTVPERKHVLEVVITTVRDRVPVVAHVGTLVTGETIELARHARSCGAQAVSVVAPYYYGLPANALVEHFCRVAAAVDDMSVFLYNIPQCTGNNISQAVAKAVIERRSNVVGIKDSSGDLAALSEFVSLRDGGFQAICGSDGLLLHALEAGASASVSGNANAFPEVVVGWFEAFWRGDLEAARDQQELLDQIRESLHDGRSVSLIKRILESRGLAGGPVRPPLPEATPEMIAAAQDRLRAQGLL